MLANKLLSCVGGEETLYSDSVFSAYTYTGNGSTQTINNGIDLAGKGGMVWTKMRDTANAHRLYDTTRGGSGATCLSTDSTNAQYGSGPHITFGSSGYTAENDGIVNAAPYTYVSWTFRRSQKFFDIVTYTGNGVAGRQIPHALGVAPGMVVIKKTNGADGWFVYHVSTGITEYLGLNTTNAAVTFALFSASTESNFEVTADNSVNASGGTYVAYLFAHDTSADGIIQCGSFTTDGGGNATVNLGWEPQYLMVKASSSTSNWFIGDVMRGMSLTSGEQLRANTADASFASLPYYPTATGFYASGLNSSTTYIYLAIRRPNKPPTVGTQVYNAIARTGTGAAATVTGVGFAPDLVSVKRRDDIAGMSWQDRLRGITSGLNPSSTSAEDPGVGSFTALTMDGVVTGTGANSNSSSASYINHFFKRAPGVFDQVCYTGTGVAKTEAHGLGVVPELMIVKSRSAASNWNLEYSFGSTNAMGAALNSSSAAFGPNTYGSFMSNGAPTASAFSLTSSAAWNGSGATFVAYLFATKAGISKVFSYIGNGTSQTINCGFTTGARYVLVKSTSATGNWNVGDSTRGLSSGTDPLLYLNSTAAEITTDDWLDPDNTGFVVNETTNAHANVNGVTYIGLAFA